jgi:hypothetical protein
MASSVDRGQEPITPLAMALRRDNLFVANYGSPGGVSLTELQVPTGTLVRVVQG